MSYINTYNMTNKYNIVNQAKDLISKIFNKFFIKQM